MGSPGCGEAPEVWVSPTAAPQHGPHLLGPFQMGWRVGGFPPRDAAALCKHPWLQQSPVTWGAEWGHQDAIAPPSWWAGDLIRSPPSLISCWLCPPISLRPPRDVAEHPECSREGRKELCPLGRSTHPSAECQGTAGKLQPAPGSLMWRACVPCSPRIDLINEEPPMVFSTLLSVKITF